MKFESSLDCIFICPSPVVEDLLSRGGGEDAEPEQGEPVVTRREKGEETVREKTKVMGETFVQKIVYVRISHATNILLIDTNSRAHGVLVEEVPDHPRDAVVALRAVDEQQVGQEAELGHGKVRGHHGLHALLTRDADADVGGL
jgi:hypothetical protein